MPSGPGATAEAVHAFVRQAERSGYDRVWFSDHVAIPDYAVGQLSPPFLEPLSACAWVVGATERLQVGTDVLVAAYRHPLLARATAATVTRLGGPRLVLGVGVGYLRGEFAALGAPYERRGEDTDEFLRVFREGAPGLVQLEEPVPLWVGGNHPRALRRAALLGDGWHPLWMPPAAYREARGRIEELRGQLRGDSGPFAYSYSCATTRILERAPRDWPALRRREPDRPEFGYQPPMFAHDDGRPWLVGTIEDVASDLAALADAGVEHITLRFRGEEALEQLEAARAAADLLP